ncbi:MAG: hypothetical protein XE11_1734 [Methanomicrobiales archaeon 53_19]|nr:MAG: hypothetical protein XE11_1734 [Methanomicrobiales archaeon 53_19]
MIHMQKCLVDWDTTLFNKNVFEIHDSDSFDRRELKEIDNSCYFDEAFMSFMKVNNHDLEKIHYLEELGFNYMESQYEVEKSLAVPYKVSPFSKHCSLHVLDYSDTKTIENIENIIITAFDTDRYYLDPKLDKRCSGLRYKNWFLTSFDDQNFSTYYYTSRKQDKIVGFLMVKTEPNEVYLALGGISHDFKGYGFYASLLIDYLNYAFSQGNKKFYSSISSHNLEILNIYIYLGFSVVDEKIVMRKIYQ